MALTTQDREDASRRFALREFVEARLTATLSHADIRAAIIAVDDFFDATVAALALNPVQTVLGNLNARLPDPFKSTATVAQKATLVSFVLMKRAGVI